MSRRAVGSVLIFVAAFLFSARFVAAAIFGSSVLSWDRELFQGMMEYVGRDLHFWAALSLAAGVAYLVWGELGERSI